MNIQCKGFAGSRGGGTYFEIKNGDDPFLQFLTGNKFALKHASMMGMCNKIKTKAGLFPKHLFCLLL